MKITNEKKGIFSHFIHIRWTKKITMRAISISMGTVFPLKVLAINKSKDTHQKSVIAHFRLQSFSLDLIPCFWLSFVDFHA